MCNQKKQSNISGAGWEFTNPYLLRISLDTGDEDMQEIVLTNDQKFSDIIRPGNRGIVY